MGEEFSGKSSGERVSGGVRGRETGEFQILLVMWNALESSGEIY